MGTWMDTQIEELTRLYAKHGIEFSMRGQTATLKKGLITIKQTIKKVRLDNK